MAGRTTLSRGLIEMIKLGTADKERILRDLEAASSGVEALRVGEPALTVEFHVLNDSAAAAAQPAGGAARGEHLARGTVSSQPPHYKRTRTMPMYRLTDGARVDVLRFGRHPDQDVQLLDACVSREHGLIIFAERIPLFCDYGTLHRGVHAGSTNGSYVDGVSVVRDAIVPWLPGQALMMGTGPYYGRDGAPYYAFKITYTLHDAALGDAGN